MQGHGDGRDLPGVGKAAWAEAVDAEALVARPAQAFGRCDIQTRPAVEQALVIEQAVTGEARQTGIGPAATHAESGHHVLGRRRSDLSHPTDDLCVLPRSALRLLEAIGVGRLKDLSI